MKEGTNAFLKLPITEQEEFLEKDAPEFSKVLNRLEQKGYNKKEPIDKL
jgi:Mn-dependent DtxR family transcriptional regulator